MAFLALLLALVLGPAAWGAAFLSGTVSQQDGSDTIPLPGVIVQVRAGSPERVVRQATADSRGRYLLDDVPEGRVTLRLVATGYYTIKAGDLDSSTITRNCPPEGDCGSVDFLAARAGVIEGYLTDDFGGPVEGASVTLTPTSDAASPPRASGRTGPRVAGQAVSDDRGYFRMWDLKPGRYKLEAQMRFPFPRWMPKFRLEPREVEITGGGEPQEVRFQLQSDAGVFSISGVIEGIDAEALKRTAIGIQRKVSGDSPNFNRFRMFMAVRDGKFQIDGLEKGDYVAHVVEWGSGTQRDMRLLTELTVDRNLTDLRLRPAPPSGVRGRITFADGKKVDLPIQIRRTGNEAGVFEFLPVAGPDYTFKHSGLPAGEYVASLRGRERYLVENYTFTVQAGSMTELDLTVSSEFAKVRGTVRLARGSNQAARPAGSHFLVGLSGDRGSFSSAADENGGFVFDKVIPGEYRIAAWSDPNTNVSDEAVWKKAASAVRTITVEAGFEMDVDLTVALTVQP